MARLSGATAEVSPDPSNDDTRDSPPFFNTTFSTHRVSPLHVGHEDLTPRRLETLSRRLRDVLVGDVVRGIQVGLQATETSSGQVGLLKAVQLQWFQANTILGGEEENQSQRGLWIDIRHENAAYAGLLLPGLSTLSADDNTSDTRGSFLQLPLLLLRMPAALKNVVTDWLATTFDCRVGRMTIGTKTILGVWESWVEAVGIKTSGPDFTVTLAFNVPLSATDDTTNEDSDNELVQDPTAPGLRSIDITISPQDLRRFARAGAGMQPLKKDTLDPWENDTRERRRLAGGNLDDGWAWRAAKDAKTHPFTEALSRYLSHHLALDLFHPSVRVTQISCSGFVLGQSRLKIVRLGELTDDLSRAAWAFVEQLGDRIQGDQLPQLFSLKFTG
ncbi:kinetochore complex Sim4 subunit Fta1-domain-containing protein [Dactylonectria estremocensis]|uniref:Kinetochore complex Sim4 subunit Fta1-domain-containing protein n=1 Tax=Dactylonectria estremocensis TaxID=1079267 RepID=A0A9P9JEF7_9HYPO|nr:kinetochore complex Sim4 subunit Fta1-domain-containing protein [Dactylonectria estremocensis]